MALYEITFFLSHGFDNLVKRTIIIIYHRVNIYIIYIYIHVYIIYIPPVRYTINNNSYYTYTAFYLKFIHFVTPSRRRSACAHVCIYIYIYVYICLSLSSFLLYMYTYICIYNLLTYIRNVVPLSVTVQCFLCGDLIDHRQSSDK